MFVVGRGDGASAPAAARPLPCTRPPPRDGRGVAPYARQHRRPPVGCKHRRQRGIERIPSSLGHPHGLGRARGIPLRPSTRRRRCLPMLTQRLCSGRELVRGEGRGVSD